MIHDVFDPFLSLTVELAALFIAVAWLSYRTRKRVARHHGHMADDGCMLNAYELLRRLR